MCRLSWNLRSSTFWNLLGLYKLCSTFYSYVDRRLFGCTTLLGTPATCTFTQFVLCLIRTSGFVLERRAEECKYIRSYCERYFSSFGTTVTVIFVWYNEYILSVSRILELRKCEKLVSCLLSSKFFMPKKKKSFKLCVTRCPVYSWMVLRKTHFRCNYLCSVFVNYRDRGTTVVKALCYKPEGRWFDSR